MAKFKKGDRVEVLSTDSMDCFNVGDIGIVDENNSTCPYVLFDGVEHAMYEHQAELIEDTKVNRLKGLKLRFNVKDCNELNIAIRTRLKELGALGDINVLGFSSIYFNGERFWGFSAHQYDSARLSILDDLYHLPKAHTITLEDGRQVELSEESYRQFEDVAK